jgi:ATP-dependent helicase YprA (DUF1998 family)
MTGTELGVNEIADRIHGRLQRYLEAQYHIRNADVIEERRALLREAGQISQRPFVEVTPSYAVVKGYDQVKAPAAVTSLLSELCGWSPGIGVYPPYKHQADALESFFRHGQEGDDLIVATGTGSGKTETFLNAVLGSLALEATDRPESFHQGGVRALLLYPMNALVSDQTARLRRLFGDERLAKLFRERWGRHPRFGMYTSRTPYPGVRTGTKDAKHIAPLLEYYEELEASDTPASKRLVKELRDRGRWPAKDITGFFGRGIAEQKTFQSGKRAGKDYTRHRWDQRLVTQPGDRELLTRHEMQASAPDLLVTNYSMLEYMLLRPIERSIFAQTRAWLAADPKNQLLLILDEAHMYRGVGGAEVGLLIRRLQARLGITRDRLRCILTSASLGAGEDSETTGKDFARGLTGERTTGSFEIVRGTREARSGARSGTRPEAEALATIDAAALAAASSDHQTALDSLRPAGQALGWPDFPGVDEGDAALRQFAARQLTGFGPLELLIERCSSNALEFSELTAVLFPEVSAELAASATDGLLALGCFARRWEPGRQELPLTPTRVHLMYRGLPPLYACVNRTCSARRDRPSEAALLGRLYTEPRTQCECGARVFELYTHRDCGAAYLRVFGNGPNASFLWHERGGTMQEFGRPLHELHLFLEEPHPKKGGPNDVERVWLDVTTGRVAVRQPDDETGFRQCYRPAVPDTTQDGLATFATCPACTRRTRTGGRALKIMDLSTKGEQPFANLVREQFVCQVATKQADEMHPNAGRKALLFSDGRQKAARLARDLPREVERDSFREAVVAATGMLKAAGKDARLDSTLYLAFVAVCSQHHLHLFDGQAQRQLLEDCRRFRQDFDGDLSLALDEEWTPEPPLRFRQALLRQLCDPYYSLLAACAAVVEPRKPTLRQLERRLGDSVQSGPLAEVASAWIHEMLLHNAFDPAISRDAREDVSPYFEPLKGENTLKKFFEDLSKRAGWNAETTDRVRDALLEVFTREGEDDSGRVLTTDTLLLRLALDDSWCQCLACGNVQPSPLLAACSNCGEKQLEDRPPSHPYMMARKDFFREPLRAVLRGERPIHLTSEEHTAQLSHRDAGVIYATTEQFELRFQDVPLGEDKPPVDILSCTTTMEVGIDIGSLTAVGLRTVPPQRENYQQRAGRAGRRGTSISTVLTFAQGGAHDAHYFAHPHTMISGPPRDPKIKADNLRLAKRHIHSYLLQTFFHMQLDGLSEEAQRSLAASRPNIMSAFGPTAEFFSGEGDFTLSAFEQWLNSAVFGASQEVLLDIIAWLPKELFAGKESGAGRTFVEKVTRDLLIELQKLVPDAPNETEDISQQQDEEEETSTLLDHLFDKGLLPSYAFPTDLASFAIQEWGDKGSVQMKERPQLAKAQALSEYAPGRLLVVNKRTYRVGGIFVDGPPTGSPAVSLFATPRMRYTGCKQCSFVKLEPANSPQSYAPDSPCPVCQTELQVKELLDPPGFSPEGGKALRDNDRDQDITFASTAQLPEFIDREEFAWRDGAGERLQYAHGEDVTLVVVNKGQNNEGFAVCELCGAAGLSGEAPAESGHVRPFLIPKHILGKEHAAYRCRGSVRNELFLGHHFRTDILVLRVRLRRPFDFSPQQPWLYDALATFAEGLALGASLHLDIDPGELSAGYRLLPATDEVDGIAEVYLFDTASGGAGYAAEAGANLQAVLDQTELRLRDCPAGCERSCTQCLRHYGNRFLHPRLDRHLGLGLLRYARFAEVPAFEPAAEQARRLQPLARFLQLEGWQVEELVGSGATAIPLVAKRPGGEAIKIGLYPALRLRESAEADHPLRAGTSHGVALLPDYLVGRDLPSAYQSLVGSRPTVASSPKATSAPAKPARQVKVAELPSIELPVVEMSDLLEGRHPKAGQSVLLATDAPPGSIAVRVPSNALHAAGISEDGWVVLRVPTTDGISEDGPLLLAHLQGQFRATKESWTIAHARQVAPGAGAKVQISYNRPEALFRPERLDEGAIRVLGSVHAIVSKES